MSLCVQSRSAAWIPQAENDKWWGSWEKAQYCPMPHTIPCHSYACFRQQVLWQDRLAGWQPQKGTQGAVLGFELQRHCRTAESQVDTNMWRWALKLKLTFPNRGEEQRRPRSSRGTAWVTICFHSVSFQSQRALWGRWRRRRLLGHVACQDWHCWPWTTHHNGL